MVIVVEESPNPSGLAIVMHGLGGDKNQPHIIAFAEAFKEKNYTVVRFDTTNTFGESEGQYEDLEDVSLDKNSIMVHAAVCSNWS